MKRFITAAAALGLLAACSPSNDQPAAVKQTETAAVNNTGITPGAGARAMLADFVPRAASSDLFEIEAGKVAAAKGVSGGVREFGVMMQADHAKSTADLKAALAAAGQAIAPPTTLPADKQTLLDALRTAAPADFDRIYLTQQEAAHADALLLMKTYADTGDVAQVKAFASTVAPVVQMHLDKVRELRAAQAK